MCGSSHAAVRTVIFFAACALWACEGSVGGKALNLTRPSEGKYASAVCTDTPIPGPAPLRRLTNEEWQYTVGDLFGQAAMAQTLSRDFTSETLSLGFRNNALFLEVQPVMAQKYMDAAEKIAEAATADLSALLPCSPATGEAECALQFIHSIGKRAYRRPLTEEEVAALQRVYTDGRAELDFKTGIQWVIFGLLQSPNFLYRVEIPSSGTDLSKVAPYEMATRLSYLLWHSMPDDALLTAAEEGKLRTRPDLEREARRMIEDPKGRRFISFFNEWLDVDALPETIRDSAVYPTFNEELRDLMQKETDAFVEHVLWESDGKLNTLLTAPFSFMNDKLAAHYGVSGVTGSEFRRVDYGSNRRAGILSHGSVLAVHDKSTRTSIVRRGLKVRTDLLCQRVGSPPDDVVLDLGPIDQEQTQAEKLAQHRTNVMCVGCHRMMDPIGQAFEELDALGRQRIQDEFSRPISAEGEIEFTVDIDGMVDGQADLASKLASSEEVQGCLSTQIFRFAYGRADGEEDACSVAMLKDRFEESGYDLRELILGLTQTDAFFLLSPVTQ